MTKFIAVALVASTLVASPALASWSDTVFTDLQQSAPRSVDPQSVMEKGIFDQLNDTAPVAKPSIVVPDRGDGALDSE